MPHDAECVPKGYMSDIIFIETEANIKTLVRCFHLFFFYFLFFLMSRCTIVGELFVRFCDSISCVCSDPDRIEPYELKLPRGLTDDGAVTYRSRDLSLHSCIALCCLLVC